MFSRVPVIEAREIGCLTDSPTTHAVSSQCGFTLLEVVIDSDCRFISLQIHGWAGGYESWRQRLPFAAVFL
jgi:hypothetical protein